MSPINALHQFAMHGWSRSRSQPIENEYQLIKDDQDNQSQPIPGIWSPSIARKRPREDESKSEHKVLQLEPVKKKQLQISIDNLLTPSIKVLLSSENSVLWAVEHYISPFIVRAFDMTRFLEPMQMVRGPEVEMYGKICHAKRSMRYVRLEEIEGDSASLSVQLLRDLGSRLSHDLNYDFDGALLNLYTDGNDYIGSHRDREVPPGGSVACVSFGATRLFRIRDRQTKKIVLDYEHTAGTLLVMYGRFQEEFKHEVPVQKKISKARLSITFRQRRVPTMSPPTASSSNLLSSYESITKYL